MLGKRPDRARHDSRDQPALQTQSHKSLVRAGHGLVRFIAGLLLSESSNCWPRSLRCSNSRVETAPLSKGVLVYAGDAVSRSLSSVGFRCIPHAWMNVWQAGGKHGEEDTMQRDA